MNEMSNDQWVLSQRIKMYLKKSFEVINSGGSFHELSQITDMGMGLRVVGLKDKIEDILSKDIDASEKAQLIAEELVLI